MMPEQTNNIEINFPSNFSFFIIFMKNICTRKLPRIIYFTFLSFQSHTSLNDIIKKKFGQMKQKYRKEKPEQSSLISKSSPKKCNKNAVQTL
jgi:archaellum biogenesis protein FlaJ (TadC family)